MILDRLTNGRQYVALHPGFAAAFETLADPRTAMLPVGRHTIDGERLAIIVGRDPGRGREGARLEAHRRFIDIQLTVSGQEEIGWLPLADCLAPTPTGELLAASYGDEPYDAGRDIAFYSARPETWLALPSGTFAIFFPDDAHAPLAGEGEIVKVVAKVAVDW